MEFNIIHIITKYKKKKKEIIPNFEWIKDSDEKVFYMHIIKIISTKTSYTSNIENTTNKLVTSWAPLKLIFASLLLALCKASLLSTIHQIPK
jgi:hypothetical protein